jgi:hypothetical protein
MIIPGIYLHLLIWQRNIIKSKILLGVPGKRRGISLLNILPHCQKKRILIMYLIMFLPKTTQQISDIDLLYSYK